MSVKGFTQGDETFHKLRAKYTTHAPCCNCRTTDPALFWSNAKLCRECSKAAVRAFKKTRRDRGLCGVCSTPLEPHRVGRSRCDRCHKREAERARSRAGLPCTLCNVGPRTATGTICNPCNNAKAKARRVRCKKAVYDHYGHACVCCGEANAMFLSIDHINNDGNEHRRNFGSGNHIYLWLVNHKFPDGFQVMCYNCNLGKARNGGVCPHKNIAQ